MKKQFRKFFSLLVFFFVLAVFIFVPAIKSSAQFQIFPAYGEFLTNNPALVPSTNAILIYANITGGTTNFVNGSALTNIGVAAIRVPKGASVGFSPYFCQTNNVLSGSNVVFNFNVSLDGTNWTTSNPFNFTFAPATNSMQGSFVNSACRGYTNFPFSIINAPWIRLDSITTINSNHMWLTNATFSIYQ